MIFIFGCCRRIPPPAPTDGAPKNTASSVTDHTASIIHHVQGRSIIHHSSFVQSRPRQSGAGRQRARVYKVLDAARRVATRRGSSRSRSRSMFQAGRGSVRVRAVGGGGVVVVVVLPVSSCFRSSRIRS